MLKAESAEMNLYFENDSIYDYDMCSLVINRDTIKSFEVGTYK